MILPRIAIYYSSLECVGGIERVIAEHTRIFSEYASYILLMTSVPIKLLREEIKCDMTLLNDDVRQKDLSRILEEHAIEWLILHNPSDKNIEKDIETVHKANCKVALNIHFSFPSPIYFTEAANLYSQVVNVGNKVDAIACVSDMDMRCWQSLGLKAYHVQNPFVHSKKERIDDKVLNHNIIWVGRGAPPKKPFSALEIMQLVVAQIPNAVLTMVGVGRLKAQLLKSAQSMGIENNIVVVEEATDVSPYYQKASLHLLTSLTESFCLVIAEAKQYGLPTVMYDIPFLELIESGEGVIRHTDNDNKSMANSIVELFKNESRLQELSNQAKASLAQFNDEAVAMSWALLFSQQLSKVDNLPTYTIREMVKAWNIRLEQDQWKIRFCDMMNKCFGSLFERFANGVMRLLESLIQLKRKIR